jgi:hypothetical protein
MPKEASNPTPQNSNT